MTVHARSAGLGVVAFVLCLAGLAFYAKAHAAHGPLLGEGMGLVAVAVLAVAAVVACVVGVALSPNEREPLRFAMDVRHPYRQGPVVTPTPRVSSRVTAVVILACMTFTALVVPFALHLPRWLEMEGVLGAWWLSWATILAVLAYRGQPLDERAPALWHEEDVAPPQPALVARPEAPPSRWWQLGELCFNGEGVAIALALVLVLGIAWLVVELVAPAVFFATWVGLTHALRRARASSHHGELGRSAFHGALWATTYVAPLAAVIAAAHAVAAHL
jgi:hypothetical protein